MRHVLILFALAVALIVGWGIAFAAVEHAGASTGMYWAVTTATTVGYGDVTPRVGDGHILAVGCMLTAIPSLAACFGLATSAHIRHHMRRHVAEQLDDHRKATELALSGIRNILQKIEGMEFSDGSQ